LLAGLYRKNGRDDSGLQPSSLRDNPDRANIRKRYDDAPWRA